MLHRGGRGRAGERIRGIRKVRNNDYVIKNTSSLVKWDDTRER